MAMVIIVRAVSVPKLGIPLFQELLATEKIWAI